MTTDDWKTTDSWKCEVRLESGELCGKPFAVMQPGKGNFCAYHHFQETGQKLGPLCCVFEPCPNPVTYVEMVFTPTEGLWYQGETVMNPMYLQGFCEQHMNEESEVDFAKHLISHERLVRIHTGGTPPHLDGPVEKKKPQRKAEA